MMSGKMIKKLNAFDELFEMQRYTQQMLIDNGLYDSYCKGTEGMVLPVDSVALSSYHIQQLVSEIGEVLDADKRWKNFRNCKYEPDAKLEEIADVFIVLMNVAMFSGFNSKQLHDAIESKLATVRLRVLEMKENEEDKEDLPCVTVFQQRAD